MIIQLKKIRQDKFQEKEVINIIKSFINENELTEFEINNIKIFSEQIISDTSEEELRVIIKNYIEQQDFFTNQIAYPAYDGVDSSLFNKQ